MHSRSLGYHGQGWRSDPLQLCIHKYILVLYPVTWLHLRAFIRTYFRLYVKLLFDHDRRDRRQREYTMQSSEELAKLKDILHASVAENMKNMVIATRLEVSLLLSYASVV